MLIRKYPNRRLYDVEHSRYVNLNDVAALVRLGEDVRVEDAQTGADLTREVLLQVALEVLSGVDLLPPSLLRRVIRSTGTDPVASALRVQLVTGMELLSTQLDRFEAMFPKARAPVAAPKPAPVEAPADPELEALQARLAVLDARLAVFREAPSPKTATSESRRFADRAAS